MNENYKKSSRITVIAGAGPAGLTAALELLRTTDVKPVIFEAEDVIGGISRTARYNGNRMDIGGHRFFSKSDTVMDWWQGILPLQGVASKDDIAIGRTVPLTEGGPDPEKTDYVMLCRSRLSRILFLRKLFNYPISLNGDTIRNLGLWRMMKIGLSYIKVQLMPARKENSLEDFMINRFGVELYRTFFRDYTEKVWGVPCSKISPDWGGQRIKGLSITKTVVHAVKQIFAGKKNASSANVGEGSGADIRQKDTETSLIGQFLYPKFGPGQLWETVAEKVQELGGKIVMNARVVGVNRTADGKTVESVVVESMDSTDVVLRETVPCDYFLSTMPVKELVAAMDNEKNPVPAEVKRIADGLVYRDFITVGLLLDKLLIKNPAKPGTPESKLKFVADNWIYVQESDVKLGRIQIFNNWSPYLVADPEKVWIGLEYFATEGDEMWRMPDKDFIKFAIDELDKIDVARPESVRDSVVFHIKKAYPAYFGTYGEFDKVREYVDPIDNLFLMGRNGMHKYNNMDHSMLAAMEVVKCIREGCSDKTALWSVNSEEEYHEGKKL
ncbi:Protoporphyrinogen oxidase [Fibrobacter sp. UWB15]|uniref:NAD(P)/FAD-dependent oxidoreductase n=1 Tax=unclassified Fibrobacter TaxID=2634177 RepID=UPI0009214EBE|nr:MULTISPECIES: NAD(P)/FAD-dependent oxidoreductase [unclassified Fibrobacter]PWJ61112.1 protoporphyrinogen oxidase [Fibrobacter sp. UWB6]SHG67426.1 Protoporphyrinogen oxidase [Fibrobacter sp. UWB8]SMG45284.1 Protoporphyrinogen oxidase [Fibrobacter sp. UWB15]